MFRVGSIAVVATALCMVGSAASSGASSGTAPVTGTPKFTLHSLPDDSNPGAVVKGPDGSLWATELFGRAIDRLTPTGQFRAFRLGIAGYPNYITVGADHALWFTVEPNNLPPDEGYHGQGIGRITTSGHFTFWRIPTLLGKPDSPQELVAGPGDTLWFTFITKDGGGGIGRTTLSDPGRVTAFPLGSGSTPKAIVRGPEDTFWFTDELGNRIGRITTGGEVKTYRVVGHPFGLTASPGGGFWFTEYDGNRVGQITLNGHVTECPKFGQAHTSPSFIVHKNGLFWLFRQGNSDLGLVGHLTAVDDQCHSKSWTMPPVGRYPWYLADGPGDSLAFTQDTPAAMGKITFESGPARTNS
jgi:virginiamycin B lyase